MISIDASTVSYPQVVGSNTGTKSTNKNSGSLTQSSEEFAKLLDSISSIDGKKSKDGKLLELISNLKKVLVEFQEFPIDMPITIPKQPDIKLLSSEKPDELDSVIQMLTNMLNLLDKFQQVPLKQENDSLVSGGSSKDDLMRWIQTGDTSKLTASNAIKLDSSTLAKLDRVSQQLTALIQQLKQEDFQGNSKLLEQIKQVINQISGDDHTTVLSNQLANRQLAAITISKATGEIGQVQTTPVSHTGDELDVKNSQAIAGKSPQVIDSKNSQLIDGENLKAVLQQEVIQANSKQSTDSTKELDTISQQQGLIGQAKSQGTQAGQGKIIETDIPQEAVKQEGKQAPIVRVSNVMEQLDDVSQKLEVNSESNPNLKQSSQDLQMGQAIETRHSQPVSKQEAQQTPTVRMSNLFEDISAMIRGSLRINGTEQGTQLRVNIFPEQFGHLDIRITATDGKIQAQIFTSNLLAKETLDQQVNQLRIALNQQGVNVDRIEITHQNQQQTSNQFTNPDQRFAQQQQQKRGPSTYRQGYQTADEELVMERSRNPLNVGVTKVDYTI